MVAAFSHASDAIAAALDAQVDSDTGGRVATILPALRLALLTAEGLNRDDGTYLGHAVRRCASLLAIAHVGETVLSRATRDSRWIGFRPGRPSSTCGCARGTAG